MLWILIALFFFWLIFREIKGSMVPRPGYARPEPAYKPYVAVCLTLALSSAWYPLHYWHFQRHLSVIATELADSRPATVHCNTVFDSIFDNDPFAAGHASPQSGQIVFQHPWCATLMDYLAHPDRANQQELHSLDMLTHESMHVRGELNEAKAECQAIQRNYRTAKLLGVADHIAKKNALDIYYSNYMRLSAAPERVAAYYSDQCAPGKALDEHLADSTWIRFEEYLNP